MSKIIIPQDNTHLRGGLVLIPGYGKTIKGHITVSSFQKTLTASITPNGNETALHWYSGPFRYTSIRAIYRAVFRAAKYITQNRTQR